MKRAKKESAEAQLRAEIAKQSKRIAQLEKVLLDIDEELEDLYAESAARKRIYATFKQVPEKGQVLQ